MQYSNYSNNNQKLLCMRNFPLNIYSDSLQSLVKNLLKDYHIKRSNHKITEWKALVFVELVSHEVAEKCIIAYTEKLLTINEATKSLVVKELSI